ncbi:hypothetical protein BURPS668_A1059 [Burkholderia pseudomallei 668]|nr:hypothetical protein BURPS668_A1059 [Burkholderia pseudomallei 668]
MPRAASVGNGALGLRRGVRASRVPPDTVAPTIARRPRPTARRPASPPSSNVRGFASSLSMLGERRPLANRSACRTGAGSRGTRRNVACCMPANRPVV